MHLNGARGGAPATIRVWPGRPGRAGGRAQTDERGAGVCRGRVRRRRAQGSSVLPLRSPRLLALPSALPLCFACDFSPPPAPAFVGSPPLPALLSSPPFVSPSLPRPALPAFFLLFLSVVAWSAYVRVLVPSCRVPGLPLEVLAVSSFVVLSQVPGYGASSAVPVDGIALCKTLSWRLGRRTSREGTRILSLRLSLSQALSLSHIRALSLSRHWTNSFRLIHRMLIVVGRTEVVKNGLGKAHRVSNFDA